MRDKSTLHPSHTAATKAKIFGKDLEDFAE